MRPAGAGITLASMHRRRFLELSAAGATVPCAGVVVGKEPAAALAFGVVADVQYADADPEGERHYRESAPKLKAAVADLAHERLAFTLNLGDLIDRDFRSFATVLPLFTPLGHPARHLTGNHDYMVGKEDKERVTPTLGIPAGHSAFSSSGVRFVMLDTNDVSTYKHAPGTARHREAVAMLEALVTAGRPNAQPWNGGVSQAQLAWLEQELAAADTAGAPVILCSHHPLLPADSGNVAWNAGAVVEVVARHRCVRACFAGHHHDGGQAVAHGVPFITFKSIVHEPGVTAYAVVRLFPDRLVIEGRGREPSRTLPLRG